MNSFSLGRLPRGLCLSILGLCTAGLCQTTGNGIVAAQRPPSAESCALKLRQPAQVLPMIDLGCGRVAEYLGVYTATGEFKIAPKSARYYQRMDANVLSASFLPHTSRPSEIPPSINLHPREYQVQNFIPPSRATRPARGQSLFSALFDNVVTLIYGRERALLAPQHLTTDSRGRLLVSDPAATVVHVLDGKQSFQIVGGKSQRLGVPNSVAVDAEDNIYISDPKRGLIEVFSSDGRFLREMGALTKDETLFGNPAGIAVDKDRLYVLDSKRNLLFMLDLQGNILKRVGAFRSNASGLKLRNRDGSEQLSKDTVVSRDVGFDRPTEIAVRNGDVVVLDAGGSRVRIFNLQCDFEREFSLRTNIGRGATRDVGLAIDGDGNILVSNALSDEVSVYDRNGQRLSSLGRSGARIGEFHAPTALWVGANNITYVADTDNQRVQLFNLNAVH